MGSWTVSRRSCHGGRGPEPWLPVGRDYTVRNVQSQLRDPDSHLSLYRRLLSLRRRSQALRTGAYQPVDPVPPDCFVFERTEATERVFVAINFSPDPRAVQHAGLAGRVVVSTHRQSEGTAVTGALHLQPYEAVVVA